jgi:hypothetical protein
MRKLPIIAAAVAAIAVQQGAYAGLHLTNPVTVYKATSGGGSAYGSMDSARYYTSDTTQYIGCTSAADLVSSIYISCTALDAHNNYLYCFSSTADGQARQAVAGVNSSSYIYFQADSSGNCTYISINNFSYDL